MAVAALAVALSSLAATSVAFQLAGQATATQLHQQSQAEGVLKDVMSLTAENGTRDDAENASAPNLTSPERLVRQALKGEVIVYIGKSTANKKCVTHSEFLTCDKDAGDLGNRVNTHLATSPDDFTITVDAVLGGYEVCAKREDSSAGWGMELEIACYDSSPTPSPTAESPSVAMYGDPHARNIHGQKFDLHGVENATLLRIPRATKTSNEPPALLKVDAKMKTAAGGLCKSGLYMDAIAIGGKWAKATSNDGSYVVVANAKRAVPTHRHHKRVWRLGPKKVFLMVAHGVTDSGIAYLNFRAGNLGNLGSSIGGLLGDDPPIGGKGDDDGCMSLLQIRLRGQEGGSA